MLTMVKLDRTTSILLQLNPNKPICLRFITRNSINLANFCTTITNPSSHSRISSSSSRYLDKAVRKANFQLNLSQM